MKKIKENLNKEIKTIYQYLKDVVNKKSFYIPLTIFSLISYLFSITNRTVSIDDMGQHYYYGSAQLKIKGLRWGQQIVNRLLSTIKYTPFLNRFLGLLFLICTVIIIGSIFYYFDKNKDKKWKYSLFSSFFVSYPLINEFYEYYEALTIPLMFFIISFIALYILINEAKKVQDYIFTGCVLSIVMSGYESLLFAYVTLVFIILYFEYVNGAKKNQKAIEWIKEGFSYAIPLFIALLIKYIVGYGLLTIYGLEYAENGDSNLGWITLGFSGALKQVLYNAWYYGIRALSYLPIAEFDISLILFIIYTIYRVYKRERHSFVISLLLILSIFFLPVLKGSHFAYRMAQPVHLFVSFIVYLIINLVQNYRYSSVVVCLCLFLCFKQSVCLHNYLALDNQRSDNEAYIAREIGYRIYSEFDKEKTVIFVGNLSLGNFINEQIYVENTTFAGRIEHSLRERFDLLDSQYNIPIVSTNVGPYLNWAKDSISGQAMVKEYLSYYGFDINVLTEIDENILNKYTKIARDNNMKPLAIQEFDNYIIVNLGDN